jgi:hypothetical protein
MKKRRLLFLVPFAALLLSGCSFEEVMANVKDFASDKIVDPIKNLIPGAKKDEQEDAEPEPTPEPEAAKLVSISVSGQFKTDYDLGESFDKAGIVVTAAYDDNSSKDVSSEATFSGFASDSEGDKVVTASFGGQTATFTVHVSKLGWTAEERALFDEYLHGIQIPFIDIKGAKLSYDEESEVVVMTDAEGNDLAVEGFDIADYAEKFLASEGWEDVSDEYSAYSSAPEGSFFVFEKSTETEEGIRRISVHFYGYDAEEEYSTEGNLSFYANDPFNYVFPSADIAAEFAKYNFEAFEILEPTGATYFEFYPSYYNSMYYQYGYYEYMSATLYIYGLDADSFSAYMSALEADGWVFGEPSNGLYSGTKVLTSGNTAMMQIGFAGTYTYLAYAYLVSEPVVWPTDEVAAMVQSIAPGSETFVPGIEGAEAYQFYTETELDIYGDASLEEEYIAILKEAGWTEDPNNSANYISPAQDIFVQLSYNDYYECLVCVFGKYVAPSAEWPTDDVAALFPAGVELQDSLPAFEGEAESFQAYSDAYGSGVTVFVEAGSEDAAITEYCATLVENKFTAIENDSGRLFYRSEHDEFTVEVWKGTEGAFNIEISAVKGFITRELTGYFTSQDVDYSAPDFGEFESACTYSGAQSWYYLFQFSGNLEAELCAVLGNNGFTVPSTPSEKYGYECIYDADSDIEIDVKYNSETGVTSMIAYYWGE